MNTTLEDLINRADALFYEMAAIADPARADEREAVEDRFDAWYAEAMKLAGRTG